MDSFWQTGKLRPQSGVSSSTGTAAEEEISGTGPTVWHLALCTQPSRGGHKQGAGCVAARSLQPHGQPPRKVGGHCTAQPQTGQESENKPWLAAEFLFPSKQAPYCTRADCVRYRVGRMCYRGPQGCFLFSRGITFT